MLYLTIYQPCSLTATSRQTRCLPTWGRRQNSINCRQPQPWDPGVARCDHAHTLLPALARGSATCIGACHAWQHCLPMSV